MFFQSGLELLHGDRLWGLGVNSCHAAADGLDVLGLEFRRTDIQSLADPAQIGIQHDAAVVHDPAFLQILGIPGELLAVDDQVVSSREFRLHPEILQCFNNWEYELGEIDLLQVSLVHNKGEVQISHVVEDRAASGKPPGHPYPGLVHVLLIHLFKRILILSDDDSVRILPQHKIAGVLRELLENELLQRQVIVRVSALGFQVSHDFSPVILRF